MNLSGWLKRECDFLLYLTGYAYNNAKSNNNVSDPKMVVLTYGSKDFLGKSVRWLSSEKYARVLHELHLFYNGRRLFLDNCRSWSSTFYGTQKSEPTP
jgi:hypothetical protein